MKILKGILLLLSAIVFLSGCSNKAYTKPFKPVPNKNGVVLQKDGTKTHSYKYNKSYNFKVVGTKPDQNAGNTVINVEKN